jgi:hypothetical protein
MVPFINFNPKDGKKLIVSHDSCIMLIPEETLFLYEKVMFRKNFSFCVCLFEVQIVDSNRECMRDKTEYPVVNAFTTTVNINTVITALTDLQMICPTLWKLHSSI